jgi:ABC-type Mn2+/Zn2+ transport system ATPase subunit
MSDSIISIKDAVVSYREDVALRGVSLEVNSGEFVGIVGPNGAGKTTILTVLNGIGKLRHGRVRVLGQLIGNGNGNGHSLRKRVGYVAQAQNIDPRMPVNVREVVMMGRYGAMGIFHRPGKADWKIVDEMLDLVGMKYLSSRPIGHLSGGEQQRVAIARAIAKNPSMFLADEPTGQLDSRSGEEIINILKSLHAEQGITVLMVTHDANIASHCQRIVHVKDGEIVTEENA